jgi:hypothetical protein
MVRSLVLVLAAVLAVVLLVPRPDEPVRQPVDVGAAAQAAAAADAPWVDPEVPAGWSPTSARFEPSGPDGVATWHVGYLTPSQRYAAVEMAAGATPRWLREQTSNGRVTGTQQVAGATWQQLLSDDGSRRSLVLELDGVTTVVTGSASLDELAALADATR